MKSSSLVKVTSRNDESLYRWERSPESLVDHFVVSTAETRSICNDPLLFGVDYTTALRKGVEKALSLLEKELAPPPKEKESTVFHILRGGLNFGLREALAGAWGWNQHDSAFVSAQRKQIGEDGSRWEITEDAYQKIYPRPRNTVFFGDVVATGTSLRHGLAALEQAALNQEAQITQVVFFTIGSKCSSEILEETAARWQSTFSGFQGAAVVYFEGVFPVAAPGMNLRIFLEGTDLLRQGDLLAPEFVASQAEDPAYPLERCTIYDAGSRAFHTEEYLTDVQEYWTEVRDLACKAHQNSTSSVGFTEYLRERLPGMNAEVFAEEPSLLEIAEKRLRVLESLQR